jgi:transposase
MVSKLDGHLFLLKDAELKGKLEDKLRSWYGGGKSQTQIVELLSQRGVSVSQATVYDWLKELGIEKGKENGRVNTR